MTGTKRTPIARPSRHPLITDEALQLFMQIEAMPKRKRGPKVYNDLEHKLAKLLGLLLEWWNGNSVCDDSDAPCWPPGLVAYENWFKVRRVREKLLEMARTAAT
jgi:hypothetical protein